MTMQTRLLPAHARSLRENLPHTFLQLTYHPQHYDLTQQTPEAWRATFDQVVEDVECRDAHFVVFAVAHQMDQIGILERNLEVLYDALAEINR